MKCVFTRQQSLKKQTLSGGLRGLGGICAVNNNDRLGHSCRSGGHYAKELKITPLFTFTATLAQAYAQ